MCIFAVITASPVTNNTTIVTDPPMTNTNITAVIASFTSVIVAMFVAIVMLVSAFCVYSRLHKHRATVTNDTLYDEPHIVSEQRGTDLEAETGQVYEDIDDITGAADGVLATSNIAYGVIQPPDQDNDDKYYI